jgi:hypothetical protein
VALFPVPLARAGFYPASLTEYVSCVPSVACPGADASAVREKFANPLASGRLGYVTAQFRCLWTASVVGVRATVQPCKSQVLLYEDYAWVLLGNATNEKQSKAISIPSLVAHEDYVRLCMH